MNHLYGWYKTTSNGKAQLALEFELTRILLKREVNHQITVLMLGLGQIAGIRGDSKQKRGDTA